MQTQIETTRTANREYYVHDVGGIFIVNFRPINPKTGLVWQAARQVKGHNCHRFSNHHTGAQSAIIDGKPAEHPIWCEYADPSDWRTAKWNGYFTGFKTIEDARAARDKHIAKSA